jgi:dynein heavy chain
VPTVDNNLCESLMRILDCFIYPYRPAEGHPAPTDIMISDLATCIDALFLFALIWSVGATVNDDGRKVFDAFLRTELFANKFPWPLPKSGMVYDYLFVMDAKKWIPWMDISEPFQLDGKQLANFSEIVVPTTDSVRNTYLLDILLTRDKHVLMVGNTGTGKTINIAQYLSGAAKYVTGGATHVVSSNVTPLGLMFSANTSANMTQDLLDAKMDKRKRGVFGPAAGKKYYVYVDDLNMPKREEYGGN